MNIRHGYKDRTRGVVSLEAFSAIMKAVERHDLLNQWLHDKLIQIYPFVLPEKNESTAIAQVRTFEAARECGAFRIIVGDTYIDEPVAQFPSERLIATIALILQARGEI